MKKKELPDFDCPSCGNKNTRVTRLEVTESNFNAPNNVIYFVNCCWKHCGKSAFIEYADRNHALLMPVTDKLFLRRRK